MEGPPVAHDEVEDAALAVGAGEVEEVAAVVAAVELGVLVPGELLERGGAP